jgi:DNA mismatch repair protein MutL
LAQLTLEGLSSGIKTTVAVEVESGVAKKIEEKDLTGPEEIFAKEESTAETGQEKTAEKNLEQEWAVKVKAEAPAEIKVLGQLHNSFILGQRGADLLIIDQHAAHERIRYNKLMAEGENEEKVVQPLLTPITVELSQQDIAVLNSNKEALEAVGMGIEHFGGNTFAITAIPAFLAKANLEKVLQGLLDDFRAGWSVHDHGQEQRFKGDFYARKEKILTYLACRSAVKFGDPLSQEEMVALVDQLEKEPNKTTCPHGRPAMIVVESEELWSRFGRKYTGFFEKEKFRDVNC